MREKIKKADAKLINTASLTQTAISHTPKKVIGARTGAFTIIVTARSLSASILLFILVY